MRLALAALCVILTGCSRYADFTLPPLQAKPGKVVWGFETRPQPVLSSVPGFTDVLNPSVTVWKDSFYNLFSGYDGKAWHTGLATSPDATTWTVVNAKVLSPDPRTWEGDYIAANGSALRSPTEFFYWYQGGREPRIGLARSPDGIRWARHPQPVLGPGPRGSWNERGVADPYVIRAGKYLYMYYLGQDRAQRQRLGVARSEDGVRWESYKTNPFFELGGPGDFDEIGLGEPAVFTTLGSYWMLYTGRDREEHRAIGLARSQDGVHWTRVSTKPVFTGNQWWDSKVVCDPSVMVSPGGVRVWFGGGDRPEPAENLHGQIGYADLKISIED
jgi:predicted GH43/DUF377 family glycosyl hydrolase